MNYLIYKEIKKDLNNFLLFIILGYFLIVAVMSVFKIGYDTTDDGRSRSGMELHIDNLTGCHYLASGHGGMVARVTKDGTHICTGQE